MVIFNTKMTNQNKMTDAQLAEVARLFGILSEPSRLRLLRELLQGPRTVTELIELTGLRQGNVSKHLGVLNHAGFVRRQQDGNFARYHLLDARLEPLCELMCGRARDYAIAQAEALAPV